MNAKTSKRERETSRVYFPRKFFITKTGFRPTKISRRSENCEDMNYYDGLNGERVSVKIQNEGKSPKGLNFNALPVFMSSISEGWWEGFQN